MLNAISKLEQAIDMITEERIWAADIHEGNILFDEDSFNIIDTISYTRLLSDGISASELTHKNKCAIFYYIYPHVFPESLLQTFNSKHKYESPYEAVEEYIQFLRKTLGENFKTLQDAEDIISEKHLIL